MRETGIKGVFFAGVIFTLWFLNLYFLLSNPLKFDSIYTYVGILIQTHLYTGLFITAHDAMHGTVSSNKNLNVFVGWICTISYALFSYKKLHTKHHQHHQFVHTDKDPDFYSGSFWAWYYNFLKGYTSIWQIIGMAIAFNILNKFIPEPNLILFWVLPALLSTLQLFYFGTYQPHKGEHDNIHQSTTLKKNHFYAFITCYFFGYHFEHHDSPRTPWWSLYRMK